jgi:diguanylate cyclase (GGDEF)-like protein
LLLVRVRTGGALQLPVVLWEPNAFLVADQNNFATIMLFAGIMLAMAIYNLLLYSSVRETAYFWYVLSVVAIAWGQLGIRGLTFQYLWPHFPQLNEVGLTTAIALNVVTVAFFSDRFLNIKATSAVISRGVRGFGWAGRLLMLFAFFVPYVISIRPLILLAFVSSLMVFVLGIYLWYKGNVLARFHVAAWSLFLIGTATYTLNKAGVLPYAPFFEYAMMIGASFQVLCLSFALAYRINLERQRRQKAQADLLHAQDETLRAQKTANEQLEARVMERTEELELAYRELKRISQIDGLTKVKNRQWFDQELETEWRRNTRESTDISLLMLDADFFKKINDTWGHPCGDTCLQFIATVCGNAVMRAGDTVARYGGEEFVVMLPYTNMQGAAIVAERIRSDIAETGFEWKGKTIKFTVSIGVASCIPERGVSYEQLVQQADQALYAAKAGGRNCVRFFQSNESKGADSSTVFAGTP